MNYCVHSHKNFSTPPPPTKISKLPLTKIFQSPRNLSIPYLKNFSTPHSKISQPPLKIFKPQSKKYQPKKIC